MDEQDVLNEFNFGDGVVNAGDGDAQRMAAEIVHLRNLLVFADGCTLAHNQRHGDYDFVLADLYAEDCEWAQQTLTRAGCHPRGRFLTPDAGSEQTTPLSDDTLRPESLGETGEGARR